MAKYVVLFIVVVALGTFFGTSQSFKNTDQVDGKSSHRGVWVDDTGQLHVMGIVLNKSSVRDAELALRSRSQTAIFMYPEAKHGDETHFRLSLEAYFPSIADHSKVILILNVSEEVLEKMRQRGTSPRMYPNGVARINIANEDILPVQKFVIQSLHVVPSIGLELAMLESQFGQAEQKSKDEEGAVHYLYPAIGLDAVFPVEGKATLIFTTPKQPNLAK